MLGDTFAGDIAAPVRALLRQSAADSMFGLGIACLAFIVAQLYDALPVVFHRPALRGLGLGFLGLVLFDVGVTCQAHHGTFFATGNGLTAQIVEESMSYAALKELVILMTASEIAFVFLPVALFIGFLYVPRFARRTVTRSLSGAAVILCIVALIVPAAPLPEALLHHPVGFIALDFLRSRHHRPLFGIGLRRALAARGGNQQAKLGAELSINPDAPPIEDSSDVPPDIGPLVGGAPEMALVTPRYLLPPGDKPAKKNLPKLDAKAPPYNVLFVLMESTGFEYALKPIVNQPGEKVAMPFLRALAEKSYVMRNHFSSGNSSPRGIFSLLSGLYVMPEVSIFDVRRDIYVPSLASYLGPRYHRFLVTPASLDWYFPHAFMLHSGLSELWGYYNVPVRKNAPGRAHARDESETVSFFLRRLDDVASGGPFLGIYYSFLAHWPYPDYGPDSHVVSPNRPLHHYYNDLHFLDGQIALIFKHLEEKKLLDNTIVVLVGDHGEAFGQHPHNYTHSRMSYNENLRTPAIIYQPKLFPAREITAPTSHVDILPTLLDALGVSYDPLFVQGESLFLTEFRRRYIFIYGNENTLTSVSRDLVKLQISLHEGSCWVYDLKADPEEHKRLGCQNHTEQQAALLDYRRHQQTALRRYNQVAFRRQSGHSP